jgi:photosystem II stability/assembly factor-like uncharacterized protein
MKIKRIVAVVAMSLFLVPALASAQSFWLHKQVFGNSGFIRTYQIAAADTTDYLFVPGGFHPAITRDYWDSWTYGFIDTAKRYGIDHQYSISGFVHPAHDLILLGCNAPKLKDKPPFPPGGHILCSINGGVTWTDTALGSFDSTKPRNDVITMASLDSNHIVVLLSGDRSLHSSDGGVTWQSISCPLFPLYTETSGLQNTIVAYPTYNTLVVAALMSSPFRNSKIYRTTDLGITWDSGFQTNKTITKFAFRSPLIGFTSGFSSDSGDTIATIDKTTDGGLTWSNILSRQYIPSSEYFKSSAGLHSIAFADSLHGLACGDYGLILRTTDGGTSWTRTTSDFTFDAGGVDLLGDIAYPDTNHAIITSCSGEALVYHPNGILSLPNITYPLFLTSSTPKTFDITWDAVPGATRYSISISTSGYPNATDTLIVRDTNVMATSYHLINLADTSPGGQTGRQYYIRLQAFSKSNQSNIAMRAFIVHQPSNVVSASSKASAPVIAVYPNPATNELAVTGAKGRPYVVDVLGRSYACTWQSGKLNIAGLHSGVFYVTDGISHARFIKR